MQSKGVYIGLKHSKSQQYIDENSSRTYISTKEFPIKIQIVIDVHAYINKWLIIMIKWLSIVVNRTIGLKVLLWIRQRLKRYHWDSTNKGLNGTVVNLQTKGLNGTVVNRQTKGLKGTVVNQT